MKINLLLLALTQQGLLASAGYRQTESEEVKSQKVCEDIGEELGLPVHLIWDDDVNAFKCEMCAGTECKFICDRFISFL